MAAVKQPALAGLGLDDYVQGGLIDDVDVEIVSLRAVMYDYGGDLTDKVLAVCAMLKELKSGEISDCHYSAGTGFVPSADGTGFVPVEESGRTALTRGTNWHIFHKSLHENGGLPANKLREPGGLSLLDGAVIHIKRVPEPERSGLGVRPTKREGQTRTIPICFGPALRWPWEAKGKKPAAAVAGRPAAAAAPAATPAADTAESLAIDGLMKAFGDTDSMDVTVLKKTVFSSIGPGADKTLRAQATKLVADADWLSSQGYLLEGPTVEKIPV